MTIKKSISLPSIEVSGRFKLQTFKGEEDKDGNIIEKIGSRKTVAEFNNIITNQGLDRLGSFNVQNQVFTHCHVGTGSATPQATDTSLQTFLAATNTVLSTNESRETVTPPYYVAREITFRFGEGEAAGNLSEVGIGWSLTQTDLSSRALILDSGGSPTTITVLSTEFLDVIYEFRVYPPSVDATDTVNIAGEIYDITVRPASFNTLWTLQSALSGVSAVGGSSSRVYEGTIGATIFDAPSGSASNTTSVSNGTYGAGTYRGAGTFNWGLSAGNFAGGIRSAQLTIGWTAWQIEFSNQTGGTTIPKDNTETLALSMTHTWARKTL